MPAALVALVLATDPAAGVCARTFAAWGVPGAAVAVVKDGRVVLLRGFGTLEAGRPDPVTPDTVFPVGSCTKGFTSAAVAALADAGKLAFDDPVRKHLPDFHLYDPAADAAVTLRDILTHRTGVAGHDLLWYRVPWSQRDAVAKLARLEPAGPFRASYHYSSLQYLAAGQAAGAAGGKPWDRLVRDALTGPLGMTATTFVTPASRPGDRRAAGHRRTPGGVEVMPEYAITEPNPSGSVYSTARDLVPWLRFHLADGDTPAGRLVSRDNLRETRRGQNPMPLADPGIGPVYPDSARVEYAMGWVRYDHRGLDVCAHGGVTDGFRAQITLVPGHDLGVAILSNLDRAKVNVAVTNALVDHYCRLPAKDWAAYYLRVEAAERAARAADLVARDTARGTPALPGLPLPAYAGTFRDAAYGPATVAHAGGKLTLAFAGVRSEITPYHAQTFRFTSGPLADELAEFRVTNGKPDAVRVVGRVFTRE